MVCFVNFRDDIGDKVSLNVGHISSINERNENIADKRYVWTDITMVNGRMFTLKMPMVEVKSLIDEAEEVGSS